MTSRRSIWDPLDATTDEFGVPMIVGDRVGTVWAIGDPSGVRLWNIDPASWPGIACERAGRNLTPTEWERYLPAGEPYRATCSEYPRAEEAP